MIDTRLVSSSLKAILQNPYIPLFANTNSANRDDSLATGTSGLVLALLEYERNDTTEFQIAGSVEDIFSATLLELDGGIQFHKPHKYENSSETHVGDLFTGFACKVWSRLVLNQEVPLSIVSDKAGAVVRPGLGHGDLIREFTRWIISAGSTKSEFEPIENHFSDYGWCNGQAGLASALAVSGFYIGILNQKSEFLIGLIKNLLNASTSDLLKLGPTLCHGLPGLLVVCSGVARILNQDALLQLSIKKFDSLVTLELMTQLDPDIFVDATWLTGGAGVIWAHSAVRKRPMINPLLPCDAQIW